MYKLTMTEKNSDWSFSVNNLRTLSDVVYEIASLRYTYRKSLPDYSFTVYENGKLFYSFCAEAIL